MSKCKNKDVVHLLRESVTVIVHVYVPALFQRCERDIFPPHLLNTTHLETGQQLSRWTVPGASRSLSHSVYSNKYHTGNLNKISRCDFFHLSRMLEIHSTIVF